MPLSGGLRSQDEPTTEAQRAQRNTEGKNRASGMTAHGDLKPRRPVDFFSVLLCVLCASVVASVTFQLPGSSQSARTTRSSSSPLHSDELAPRAPGQGLERAVALRADLDAVEDELGALVLLRQPALDPAGTLGRGAVAQHDHGVHLAALRREAPAPVEREARAHALEEQRLALGRLLLEPAPRDLQVGLARGGELAAPGDALV